MRRKKGVTLLGEIVAFLFLIATGYILSGAIIMAHGVTTTATAVTGSKIDYNLTMEAGYFPVAHEITLLTILESTNSGKVPLKTILTQALTQKTNQPVVNGVKITDLESTIDDTLKFWGDGYWFRLKTETDVIIDMKSFTSSEKAIFQKVSTRIYSPFQDGIVELYIFD